MSTENNVAAPVATEIQTGETAEVPEVAVPEGSEQKPEGEGETQETGKPELTAEQKAIKALEKRVSRLTAEKYQLRGALQAKETASQPNTDPAEEPQQARYTEQDVAKAARELLEVERANEKANAIAKAGEKAYPDFAEKTRLVMSEIPLYQQNGRPTPIMEAIADTEAPEAVIHHLGSNPDLIEELLELSPVRQAVRIAKLSDELAKAPQKPAATKPSNAPAPLKPVKTAATSDEPDPNDTEAWIRWSNARDAAKRKR